MHWTEKEYAFYRGDQNICDGTIHEIAAFTGFKVESVKWMTTPTSRKRADNRDCKFTTRLVPIMDESRPLMTYQLSDKAVDALSDAEIYTVSDLLKVSDTKLAKLHPNKMVIKQIARYRDWFHEVDKEWDDDCDEAM